MHKYGNKLYQNKVKEIQILVAMITQFDQICTYLPLARWAPIKEINIINIVIYRPPDTNLITFRKVIDKIKHKLAVMDAPEPTVLITGDFNFPFIEWKKIQTNACNWRKKTTDHGTTE